MVRGNEDMVVGGGEGAEPVGQKIEVGATVVAAEGEGGGTGAEPSGGDATVGAPVVAIAGDQGVAAARGSGSGDGGSGRPLTLTVEELLVAAERASDGGPADLGGEEVIVGQFSETPILRTATVLEPRSGDSGIGSSRLVPFMDRDFLESVEPRGVLDALGLDFVVATVLKDASTPEDRASASLLGALLSGAGSDSQEAVVPEAEELGGDRVDAEAAAEVLVTAPVGKTAYVPGRADYPEEMLLRDRASHISSRWTSRTTDVYGHGGSASSLAHFRALPERVHWDRWAGMGADFLPRSREVTRSRVLLECPLGWQWYLGDRVTRQSLGLPAFVVPGLLHPRVQRTESYTRAELELFTVPDTDLERHLRRFLDYAAYADRYLARSLGVDGEFERRVAGVGAWRDEGGAPSRGGRSTRGRGRGARASAGGRGAGVGGRGEGSTRVPKTGETSASPELPTLKWTIGVTSSSGAREVIDVPRLPQPPMRFPAQVPREWAEQAVMLMVGMRHLLKDCAKGRVLQTRRAPVTASPAAAQVQPRRSARTRPRGTTSPPVPVGTRGRGARRVPRAAAGAGRFEVLPREASQRRPARVEPEESEEETKEGTGESSESRVLGTSDSSTASGPSDDDGDDEPESSESAGPQQKRIRRV
ncbi:uncharacterized protein LOC131327188 [Rhododendron vialii]|uniref:uncharacterized protein LOC131327188 n=1 Tax=Rhododendron vialii TaxID=182163 RepID=UPI00265ED57F|nr:uncharacterized protein LOC131327188 [Rhododendron vialii]